MNNHYKKAETEHENKKIEEQKDKKKSNRFTNDINLTSNIPKQKKEIKKQMSIMLTPTDKKRVRDIADKANMSVSELFAFWIEQNYNN